METDYNAVLRQLTQWGEEQDIIRAMLLTSSHANPHRTIDALSDYDVILIVDDVVPFYEDRTWLQAFGDVLVAYWDPLEHVPGYDFVQVGNVVHYTDGLHIDFTVWPLALLRQLAEAPTLPADLDDGYIVLVDKDGISHGLPAPTYTAYVPAPPSVETFQRMVEEFFSDVPYVAKCLWRDELLPAKWCLDYDMKHNYLRPMLEWWIACDHGWSMPVGNLGRGLKKQLQPELWLHLETTYVGAGIEDNWDALFRTIALFARVAVDVAEQLQYDYPTELEQQLTAYAQRIKRLELDRR